MRTSYRTMPGIPEMGPLDRYDESIGIIVPYARTNLVTNPSLETNTTGYTAVGGAIVRSTAEQSHGAYSLAITPSTAPTDGAYYGTVALTAGTTYAISVDVKGLAGVPYTLRVATTGGVDLIATPFRGVGAWQWIWLFWTETSTTTRRIYLTKNGSARTGVFYADGWQVEACGSEGVFVTTYIDGDQAGLIANQFPAAFGWNGTPHASTSFRSGQTRAGGRIVRFKDFGFVLTAIIGLGLATPRNAALGFAQLDGAQYSTTIKPERTISLVGRWTGTTPTRREASAARLIRLLDRDLVGLPQPLNLCLQAAGCNAPIGALVTIPKAIYAGGVEGTGQELPTLAAQLTFAQYLPYVVGRDGGTLLSARTTFAATGILQRSPSGAWTALGTTGVDTNDVEALVYGPDGSLYAGGGFLSIDSVANTRGIARWDGTAWNAVGGGVTLGGGITTLVFDAAGNLFAGGSFGAVNGVADTRRIAKWDGSVWSALGTGMDDKVSIIAIDSNNTVYAGGSFTAAGGVANTARIAKWIGSAWVSIGDATNAVLALAIAPDNTVYAGGTFTAIGGVGVNYIAKWNGTVWSIMGPSGLGSISTFGVTSLAFDAGGLLYIGGDFTTDGTFAPLLRFATWNGIAFAQVGNGFANGRITDLTFAPDTTLYLGGTFTQSGSMIFPAGGIRWNGSTLLYLDAIIPGSDSVESYAFRPDGTLAMGSSKLVGNVTAPLVTSTINNGTVATSPKIVITGPTSGSSIIYELLNTTTNTAIYFNLTLLAGETATLTLDPQNLSFVSSMRGNIYSTIAPGSQTAQFTLQPGANNLVFFCDSATVVAVASWETRYGSLDDALYQAVAP